MKNYIFAFKLTGIDYSNLGETITTIGLENTYRNRDEFGFKDDIGLLMSLYQNDKWTAYYEPGTCTSYIYGYNNNNRNAIYQNLMPLITDEVDAEITKMYDGDILNPIRYLQVGSELKTPFTSIAHDLSKITTTITKTPVLTHEDTCAPMRYIYQYLVVCADSQERLAAIMKAELNKH